MSFTKQFKMNFDTRMRRQYQPYWHAMHPLTFDPVEVIYVPSFSKMTWAAMLQVQKDKPSIISNDQTFDYVPASIVIEGEELDSVTVGFHIGNRDLPDIKIHSSQIANYDDRRMVQKWIERAFLFQHDSNYLYRICDDLMEDFNTPGQLYRFWPSMLPFLPSHMRDTVRHRSSRSTLPKKWRPEHMRIEFFNRPEIKRLDDALLTMSLIPPDTDKNYPNLHNW